MSERNFASPTEIMISYFSQDPRVPFPDTILGGIPEKSDVPLPSPEELAAQPDIATALLAHDGMRKLVAGR